MIKSTVNPSAQAPIVAVCSHPAAIDDAAGTLFTATLSKPIMKADLLHVLSYLGFKLETKGDVLRRGSGDSGAVPVGGGYDDSDNGRRGSA
jgi:serine/threonine-protein kinase RIM15